MPIISLLTDGNPTDDYEAVVRAWEAKHKDRMNMVAISAGNSTNILLLHRLTDNVLIFDDTNPEAYKPFFNWLTDSIKTQSQKVDANTYDKVDISGVEKE